MLCVKEFVYVCMYMHIYTLIVCAVAALDTEIEAEGVWNSV